MIASARRRPVVLVAGGVVATGTLLIVGTGLHPVPWVTWAAPLPVLLMAPRVPGRAAALASFLAYLLGLGGYGWYVLGDLSTRPSVVADILIGSSAVFAAVVLLFRTLISRGRPLAAAVCPPAAWASAEYLVARIAPFGTNWSLANSQADVPLVIQVASLTGVFGVSFLVFGAAAAVAAAGAPRVSPRRRVLVVAGALCLVGGALGFGGYRLASAPDAPTVRVAVVAARGTGAVPGVGTPGARSRADADLEWLHDASEAEGTIVVFPEKDLAVDETTLPAISSAFRDAARSRHALVVLGVERHTGRQVRNTALVFPPDGAPPSAYDKQYPLAGAEDEVTPGTELLLVPTPRGPAGVAICADLGHPELGRRYASSGARLVLVPALDFTVDDWSQSRVQLLRGVESGFAIARASRRGYLTVADEYGRVRAEVRSDDGGQHTVSVSDDLALGDGPTIYARVGDGFSRLCLLITLCAVLSLFRRPRRHGTQHDRPGEHGKPTDGRSAPILQSWRRWSNGCRTWTRRPRDRCGS